MRDILFCFFFFVVDNLISYSQMNEKLAFMTKQYDFFFPVILLMNKKKRMSLIILKRHVYFVIMEIYIDRH